MRRRARRHARGRITTARSSLRQFRQATLLAVAMTGLLLLLFFPGDQDDPFAADEAATPAIVTGAQQEGSTDIADDPEPIGQAAAEEAARTVQDLWTGFYAVLPKLLVVLGVIVIAWLLVRLIRPLLRRILQRWERADAAAALFGIIVWLLTVGIVLSVLAGDIRALVGSLGLIGLALSWALQTQIESFTDGCSILSKAITGSVTGSQWARSSVT